VFAFVFVFVFPFVVMLFLPHASRDFMANEFETVELNPGTGGAKIAGDEFTADETTVFMPTSTLSKPDGEGGFDVVDEANPLPIAGEVSLTGTVPLPTGAAAEATLAAINTKLGEVQASPTQYTLLDRLKSITTAISGLATTIVLAAGSALIGKVQIRNAANGADIDPLAEGTFTARIGEVQASPTQYTLLDRLKALLTGITLAAGTNLIGKVQIRNAANGADIDPLAEATFTARVGEVQASPTQYTLLDRLKALLTGITLAAGANRIGKMTVRNAADDADIDPVAEATFTARIGEVQASPTQYTLLDRLKSITTAISGLATTIVLAAGSALIGKVQIRNAANGADIDPLAEGTFTARLGEVQASPTQYTLLDRLKALLTGIQLAAGTNLIGKVKLSDGTTDATVRDLTNSKALNVAVVDGSGNQVTSFSGGGGGGGSVPTSVVHGRKSNVDTSAAPLVGSSTPVLTGVTIRADSFNTSPVYVGGSSVSVAADDATCGYPIAAGNEITLAIDDLAEVYVISADSSMVIYFLGR